MENNLPLEGIRPEDEYPELGAEPIEAAEPIVPEDTEAEETAAAEPAPAVAPAAAEPVPEQPVPEQPAPDAPVQPQPPYTIPYMTYPMYPPMPGMPLYPGQTGQPQQPGQPQQGVPPMQPPYPQGMYYPNYPTYYVPYPPQQPGQPPMAQPGQPPQGQVPPFAAPQNGPVSDAPFVAKEEKKPASTGTKAFLIILTALLLAMVAGFIVYIAANSKDAAKDKKANDPFAIQDKEDVFEKLPDNEEEEDGELKHSELKESIKLVADDGATQKRDSDNADSIGKPDKNAKSITISAAPKDADDAEKYTAKSAFSAVEDSVVTISCYKDKITENIYDIQSSGSGTIFSADGYIITNAHVLGNSRQFAVNVTLNSGKSYQAKIIGFDTWTDLAVLKIDASGLTPAVFGDSEKVEVGDDVIAIGSPDGMKYQNSLTQGVISAVDKESADNKCVRYIQSDAAINSGSSGGPLCNLCGQVIGITTAKTTAADYENMSFSIPSAAVKDIVTDLLHDGYVPDRTRIGFSGSEVTADEKLYYSLPSGVIITEISGDGALKGTDVKKYDIVTAIDGEAVGSFQDIYNILAKHKVGDKVELSIYRIEEEGFFEEAEEPTVNAK